MNRDELYEKFGPLLIEAITLIIKDEINILRIQHGLSERSNEQIITAISNKLTELSRYDWLDLGT